MNVECAPEEFLNISSERREGGGGPTKARALAATHKQLATVAR
jgi:hypothetical protein